MYVYILQLPYYRHKQTVFEVHPTEVQFTVHNSSVSIEVICICKYVIVFSKLPKIQYTPFFDTILSGKSGKGVFVLKSRLVVCIHPSLHPVSYNVTHKIDNQNDL